MAIIAIDTKVVFRVATTGGSTRSDAVDYDIPAGANGRVIKIINSAASVVLVKGRKLVVFNSDFEVIAASEPGSHA
jgi:hypothetical protein